MSFTRRDLLKRSALGAGVVAVGNVPALFSASSAVAKPNGSGGFGPLVADPAGLLDLPQGFSYKVVSRVGDPMPTRWRGA